MKRNFENIFFQSLLCAMLIAACLTIRHMKSERAANVGAFGKTEPQANITFSDIEKRIETDFFGER